MPTIVDTGPLVAFFDKAERHHVWVNQQIDELDAPLLVCEPVLAETMYLLSRFPPAKENPARIASERRAQDRVPT
jgi:predicted nucleic acid-binding protein